MNLRKKRDKWEYRFVFEGQRISKVTDLEAIEQNRKKAEKLGQKHRDELLQGLAEARKPKTRLFSDSSEEFISFVEVEHKEKPNTIKRVNTSLSSLKVFFGQKRLKDISVAEVEKYKVWRVREHQVKEITLRHDLDNLSKFFRWAMRMKYVQANPVNQVKKPSDANARREHVLLPAEEFRYFEHARKNKNLYDVARVMLNQGMRPDEVLQLRKEDLDVANRRIQVQQGKTKSARRALRLTHESFEILFRRLEGDSRWLFPSPKKPGEALTKLNGIHNRVCDQAGVAFVLYDLRHTFATRAAEARMPVPTLAAILGHNSLRMVERYVHPTQAHIDSMMDEIGLRIIGSFNERRHQATMS